MFVLSGRQDVSEAGAPGYKAEAQQPPFTNGSRPDKF